MRKVFLDDLPRKKINGIIAIDWIKSIGLKVKFIYDDIESWVNIVGYDTKKAYVSIVYLDNPKFEISTGGFVNCTLGGLLNRKTSNFKIEIGQTFKDNKRDLIIIDREYRVRYKKDGSKCNDKWYKYTCNKCGWTEGWILESSLLSNVGCGCCNSKVIAEGINDIPTTAPWMVKYFQGGYDEAKMNIRQSGKKIYPICPDCGRIRNKSMSISDLNINNGFKCFYCSDGLTYPEKFMLSILEQLNIDFKIHKTFKWSNRKEYDFYIEFLNVIIETHGLQHYKEHGWGNKKIEEEQANDKYKKNLALSNGVKEENYIVIDCRYSELDFIKNNILNSRLSEIFDLSNIDWIKSHKNAISNKVKEVCNIHNSNNDISTKEISNITGFCRSAVLGYLHKGLELGWCNYNAEEEKIKNNKNIKKFEVNNKPVLCIETNQVFESATECSRQLNKLFKENFNQSNVSDSCNNSNTYKGLTFKYITKEEYSELLKNNKELTQEEIKYFDENIIKIQNRRKVINLETKEIFDSILQAEQHYNITNIVAVCVGKQKTSGEFRWMYNDEYEIYLKDKNKLSKEKVKYIESDLNDFKKRKYSVICLETKQVFDSVQALSKQSKDIFGINLDRKGISRNCNGKTKSYKDYHFMYYEDYLNGNNPRDKYRDEYIREIVQFDLNGNIIAIHNNIDEATNNNNFDETCIYQCCNKKLYTSYGYMWAWKSDYDNGYIPKNKINKHNEKQVICLDNGIVFESAHDCDRKSINVFGVKMNYSSIASVCRGSIKTHKGYHFMYYNDYLKQQGQQEELNNQSQDNNQTQETNQENIAI